MDIAYEKSESSPEHLEEGFYVGTNGTVTSIVEGTNDEIEMEDYMVAIKELHEKGETVDHNVHVHGMPIDGRIGNTGAPVPSPKDLKNTYGEPNSVQIILGYSKKIERDFNAVSSQLKTTYERTIGFYVKNPVVRSIKSIKYDLYSTLAFDH